MKYVLILLGLTLLTNAFIYFINLYDLISNSYEFTNYGLGILAGKTTFLLIGIFFVVLGVKKHKTKKNIQHSINGIKTTIYTGRCA